MLKFILFSILMTTMVQAKSSFLSGFDNVLTPDQEVTLKAKLEDDGVIPYRRDIPGERIVFLRSGNIVGEAITDDDGMAVLTLPSMAQGSYTYTAKLAVGSRYRSNIAEMINVVIHPNKKVIISDIDHTLSNASSWEVVVKPNSRLKPLKNAAKSIHYFQKSGFQIIYLTARDDTFLLKTKDWLKLHHFPKAPSFYWDYRGDGIPQDHGDFKSQIISKLKMNLNNILIGVGDKPHDIRAYRENGLRSYYIGKPGEVIDPDGVKVNSWDDLLKHLDSFPMGTLASDPLVL